MKTRKNSKPIIFLIVITLFWGCKYLFVPEEYEFSNIRSKEELTTAVNSVYDLINKFIQSPTFQYSELMGDDQLVRLQGEPPFPSSLRPYAGYYVTKNCLKGIENFNAGIYDWQFSYEIIASINNILSQFDLNSLNDKETEVMLGEMVFYRAYLHYRLILIYGRIPIVKDNDVNYSLPKPSYNNLYEFIEKEIKISMQMLPENKSISRIPFETPDRGCAKALLGEVYLSWGGYPANNTSKYELAIKETSELIDSASFFDYELMPDLYDVWSAKNRYTRETVFANYLKLDETRFTKYSIEHRRISYQNTSFSADGFSSLFLGGLEIPEVSFFNNFPDNYRKDITFYTKIYVDSLNIWYYPQLMEQGLDTGFFDIKTTSLCARAAYRKFYIDTLTIDHSFLTNPNAKKSMRMPRVYLIRYAQTLLTYAEASAHSGNLNEKSYECVNKVRRRANHLPLDSPSPYDLQPGLSPGAFGDSVIQERAWELAGEIGHRWFDMVRTQTVEKVFEQRDPNDGGPFKPSENDKYFFTIPEGDINLNPNLGE